MGGRLINGIDLYKGKYGILNTWKWSHNDFKSCILSFTFTINNINAVQKEYSLMHIKPVISIKTIYNTWLLCLSLILIGW